jgi:hypothetical protein
MKLFCLTIIVLLSLTVCNAQNSKPEILTNKMVVDLVKAKFSSDTIIKKIETATSVNFDTGTDDLIKLKNSGVDEKIIQAMLDKSAPISPSKSSGINWAELSKEDANGTSSPMTVELSPQKEKPKKFSIKAKSFTFDLEGCKASGDTIACEYMVTNNSELEKKIGASRNSPSTIIDERGNQYKSSGNQIGGVQDSMQPLASDIPMRGKVIFQNIEKQPTVIKLLSLSVAVLEIKDGPVRVYVPTWNYFKVEFRDVPITQ